MQEKRQYLPEGDEKIISIMNMMAKTYTQLGSHDAALEIYEKCRELSEQHRGNTEMIVASMCGVGSVYQLTGRGGEAAKVYEEALKLCRDTGLVSQVMGAASNSLGTLYMNAGRYEDAMQHLERSMETMQHMLSEGRIRKDDPDMLVLRANVGLNYSNLNRFKDAVDVLEDVYRISKDCHGNGHYITKLGRGRLANVYAQVGRLEEMKALIREGYRYGEFEDLRPLVSA
jgi:tetratricopeptide (TPR) repeat protein